MSLDEHWSFEELHAAVSLAAAWVHDLGIATRARSRLDVLLDELGRLAAATEAGTVAGGRSELFTLVEGADLRRIHQAFRGNETKGVVDRLRRVVEGPSAGEMETPRNATSRNFLAELSVAAMFELNGIAVDLEHRPDAIISLPLLGTAERVALTLEVKRPHHLGTLRKRLRDGVRQVRWAVEHGVDDPTANVVGGILVVVMDHLIPPLFARPFPESHMIRDAMKLKLKLWVEEHQQILGESMQPQIAGVMLHWRPIAMLETRPGVHSPVECRQNHFEVGTPQQVYIAAIAKNIVEALRP